MGWGYEGKPSKFNPSRYVLFFSLSGLSLLCSGSDDTWRWCVPCTYSSWFSVPFTLLCRSCSWLSRYGFIAGDDFCRFLRCFVCHIYGRRNDKWLGFSIQCGDRYMTFTFMNGAWLGGGVATVSGRVCCARKHRAERALDVQAIEYRQGWTTDRGRSELTRGIGGWRILYAKTLCSIWSSSGDYQLCQGIVFFLRSPWQENLLFAVFYGFPLKPWVSCRLRL